MRLNITAGKSDVIRLPISEKNCGTYVECKMFVVIKELHGKMFYVCELPQKSCFVIHNTFRLFVLSFFFNFCRRKHFYFLGLFLECYLCIKFFVMSENCLNGLFPCMVTLVVTLIAVVITLITEVLFKLLLFKGQLHYKHLHFFYFL